MGKSISKAFKKVVGGALGSLGLGPSGQQTAATASVPAAEATVPTDTVTDVETDASSSDQKKQRSTGKRGLSVARTSGGGISL